MWRNVAQHFPPMSLQFSTQCRPVACRLLVLGPTNTRHLSISRCSTIWWSREIFGFVMFHFGRTVVSEFACTFESQQTTESLSGLDSRSGAINVNCAARTRLLAYHNTPSPLDLGIRNWRQSNVTSNAYQTGDLHSTDRLYSDHKICQWDRDLSWL